MGIRNKNGAFGLSAGRVKRLLVVDAIVLICVLSILYFKLNKRSIIIDIERGLRADEASVQHRGTAP